MAKNIKSQRIWDDIIQAEPQTGLIACSRNPVIERIKKLEGRIQECITQLPSLIREYSMCQRNIWRKVPWLALDADGRTGYSYELSMAYRYGLWMLNAHNPLLNYLSIDLETGKILNTGYYNSLSNTDKLTAEVLGIKIDDPLHYAFEASDENIVCLIGSTRNYKELISLVNAEKVIRKLKELALEPYVQPFNAKKQNAWRKRMRRELGLGKLFTRKKE